MKDLLLCESEFRMMDVIWDSAPIESGKLVKLCEEKLSWKKSTTYTMLRKLVEKELVENNNSVVTVLVPREQVQEFESEHLVKKSFGGSLPAFVSAFLGNGSISKEEAEKLIELIGSHIEE
ncbi:MAG: BlaI/MecI/CopY family transcriptional regulator [Eubacterium sp.]|jgi:predicted transcriptional regulator|nr:BlaI/MecI/CopY family transcriptional regulator [Eubacterium sp.]